MELLSSITHRPRIKSFPHQVFPVSENAHPVTEEPGNALAPLFPPKLIHPNFVNSTFWVSPLPILFCHHLEDRVSFLIHLRASPSHCLLAFLVNVPHYSMWAVTIMTTILIYAVRHGGHRRLFNTSSAASSNWCAVNVFKDLGQKKQNRSENISIIFYVDYMLKWHYFELLG